VLPEDIGVPKQNVALDDVVLDDVVPDDEPPGPVIAGWGALELQAAGATRTSATTKEDARRRMAGEEYTPAPARCFRS
jgi:hypothetical protein